MLTVGSGNGLSSANGGVPVKFGDSPSIDAFARLRVSNPETVHDGKQIFDNLPIFYDDQEVSGSGTSSVYSQDEACTKISVSTAAGKRVRQTFQRYNYQPGKSQLLFATTNMGAGASGITVEVGQHDDNNGLFFSTVDGVLYAVMRSSTTGAPVDNAVAQSEFNIDKFDGTGPSGVAIDLTKTQIIVIDYEWLGVGRVRMGFVVDGIPYYAHQFLNANNLGTVYMSTPNSPIRYSIENDGTGPASDLDHICSSIISEGGQQATGILQYVTTSNNEIDANTVGTTYMIKGIRLKPTHLGASIQIESISMLNDTTDDYEWLVILNPTLGVPAVFTDVTNSALQEANGEGSNPSQTTVTGGTVLAGGQVKASGSSGSITIGVPNSRLIGSAIDGTPDELYLCCTPFASNANITGSFTIRELS